MAQPLRTIPNSGHWNSVVVPLATLAFASNADAGRLCQRFDDANVALGGVAQHLQCGLIAGAVVSRDGFLHVVELEDDDALEQALFVSLGGVAAGEKATASSNHRRPRELGVFGKDVRVRNRTIRRNYVS